MSNIDIVYAQTEQQARRYMQQGYCPIECVFGTHSIVDHLMMDHHGFLHQYEPVSLRAYRDHVNTLSKSPRFVVTGNADADACFAIAALAGLFDNRPGAMTPNNILLLAQTIARFDIAPVQSLNEHLVFSDYLLMWNTLRCPLPHSQQAFLKGVELWQKIVNQPSCIITCIETLKKQHEDGVSKQLKYFQQSIVSPKHANITVVIDMPYSAGLIHCYQSIGDNANHISAWRHPLICAYDSKNGKVRLSCPNDAVANSLFGQHGLHSLYSVLTPNGWGGHKSIGGSPRSYFMTMADLNNTLKQLNQSLSSKVIVATVSLS